MLVNYEEGLRYIADIICSCESVILLTHRRPDGDTIGSACALAAAVRKLGKKSKVLYSDKVPERFAFLADGLGDDEITGKTAVVAVDIASRELLAVESEFYGGKIDACIDHHKTNDGWADLTCVKTYSACGECILDLIDTLGVKEDDYIAKALYTAISTDTGCFKYGNTNAHTHLAAARLYETAQGLEELNNAYFMLRTAKEKEVEFAVHKKQKLFSDGKGCISSITIEDMNRLGVVMEELESVTDAVRTTKGVLIGAFLKEVHKNVFRVSLRGNTNGVDVSHICGIFGGGGHRGAGGCTVEGTESEAREKIEEAIANYLSCIG